MSVRVKICGVRRSEDARAAVEAGADMIGLNFWPQSKRAIDLDAAREVVAQVPARVWRVGVFVNQTREEIARVQEALDLSAIQLHGDEPPELMQGWSCPVIRAVRLKRPEDAEQALASDRPEYFLCEGGAGGGFGGAGEGFPLEWARPFPADRLLLAGGLTPQNVADAVRCLRPFAVDVASGVESAPGVKDAARMAELIENAKAA